MICTTDNHWIAVTQSNPNAKLRLIQFPYTGAGANAYRAWEKSLPPTIEIISIVLPGREAHRDHPPIASMKELVPKISAAIQDYLDKPFIFYGHSLGSVIAYETILCLSQQNLALPEHLIVSSRRAPHMPPTAPPIHALPDPEFKKGLDLYNGTPKAIMANQQLMNFFTPMLRADFALLETYPVYQRATLPIPITAMNAIEDKHVKNHEVLEWKKYTSEHFSFHLFEGDHFFINSSIKLVTDFLSNIIQQSIDNIGANSVLPNKKIG